MNKNRVTACIPTRGDRDLTGILDSLIFSKVVVWNNAEREDARTYGRYLAAEEAATDVVYFQDDDTIVPPETQQALLDAWEPGVFLANMEDNRNRSEYPELVWPGWGSLVERDSYRHAFDRWGGDRDDFWFQIVGCDVVACMLGSSEPRRVDFGVRHLDYAHGDDRAFKLVGFGEAKQDFYAACEEMRQPC